MRNSSMILKPELFNSNLESTLKIGTEAVSMVLK